MSRDIKIALFNNKASCSATVITVVSLCDVAEPTAVVDVFTTADDISLICCEASCIGLRLAAVAVNSLAIQSSVNDAGGFTDDGQILSGRVATKVTPSSVAGKTGSIERRLESVFVVDLTLTIPRGRRVPESHLTAMRRQFDSVHSQL
jgi:hypothetical protein